MTTRRRFLQAGLAGAAALLAVAALERASVAAGSDAGRAPGQEDARIARALAAVVLAGALPSSPAEREAALERVVAGFRRISAGLGAIEREQLSRLLGLLRWRPARFLLTGLWQPLDQASASDIASLLRRWRSSRFELLRVAYAGLTQLLQAAWYDEPQSWRGIGYPGPPLLEAAPRP